MKYNYGRLLVLFFAVAVITGGLPDCKKIDLVRIAAVKTEPVETVYIDGAVVYGEIIDLGEDEMLDDHGFCWSSVDESPTVSDPHTNLGSSELLGFYTSAILGLNANTEYFVRSFVSDGSEILYGNSESFTTLPGGGAGVWLSYNDGVNFDGIGMTDGSNFDIGIRFPTQALTQYNGFRISKFRFFSTAQAQFHVEIYEGTTPVYVYHETVPSPVINGWTEYIPNELYFINSVVEVWAGLWITDYVMGNYPAGVDNGPAISGVGDMISFDDGTTWESLYVVNNEFNYNWNLEVYVTDQKGKEFLLRNDFDFEAGLKPLTTAKNPLAKPVADNLRMKNE